MRTARETGAPGRPAATQPASTGAGAALPTPDATPVILQAASLLLDYPGPASREVTGLIPTALAELPLSTARRRLDRFLVWWNRLDVVRREQTYVATFDFDGGLTLYLTEARRRTPRERGAALLDLRRAYRAHGADVSCDELPDYLPLMLEVAAHVPAARVLLAAERAALEHIAAQLTERESPFGLVVGAVLAVLPNASDRGGEERS
jgi:nitrate reductase molybdenum cofactor assembly chaperone NarJ/NarW